MRSSIGNEESFLNTTARKECAFCCCGGGGLDLCRLFSLYLKVIFVTTDTFTAVETSWNSFKNLMIEGQSSFWAQQRLAGARVQTSSVAAFSRHVPFAVQWIEWTSEALSMLD